MERLVGFFERSSLGVGSRAWIRKTLSAASKGSLGDLQIAAHLANSLPPEHVAEALTLFCTFLDVPALDPEQHSLTPSLRSTRDLAILTLTCTSNIPDIVLKGEQSPELAIFKANWPNILNWMRYFCCVATATALNDIGVPFTNSESLNVVLSHHVFVVLNSLVVRIRCHCRVLYESALLNDGLLELIVKVWLRAEDRDSSSPFVSIHPIYNACWLAHFRDGIGAVDSLGKLDLERLDDVRQMILREATGDAGLVAKRLLRQLKNPAKTDEKSMRFLDDALIVAYCLAVKDRAKVDSEHTEFMDIFLKNGIVPLTMELLSIVVKDIARPRRHRVLALAEGAYENLIQTSVLILRNCEQSINGMHWAMVMLKLGFVHTITGLVMFPQYLGINCVTALTEILGRDLPRYFCHRFVVVAAINAIKEITIDGLSENLHSSPLKEAWEMFETVLMDRTVFNAVYERDFAEKDVALCFNCKKSKRQYTLFKCASCKTAVYCSKDCQTIAWKKGGHRKLCKSLQDPCYELGIKKPSSGFLHILGAFELHRHLPGVLQQLKLSTSDNSDKESVTFKDAFLVVNFCTFPPTLFLRTAEIILHEAPEEDIIKQELLEIVRQAGDEFFPFEVRAHRGGPKASYVPSFLPKRFLEGVEGTVHDAGDATKTPNSTWFLARDANGKGLPFILDEIDAIIVEARKNFRPPAPGDDESPKTIYHYVEKKVAEHQREMWTECLHVRDLPVPRAKLLLVDSENV